MRKKNFHILALVGSRKGKASNTASFCQMIFDAFKTEHNASEVTMELLTADKWHINPCVSCGYCFSAGSCPQDQLDHMEQLKKKLLSADCIFFASPVYAGAISGDMKILIDRLAYWLHTMPLIGKSSLLLSTADSNHGDSAISYMKEIVEKLGAVPLDFQNAFVGHGPILLKQEKTMAPVLKRIAKELSQAVAGNLTPTAAQEQYFKTQTHIYKTYWALGENYPGLCISEARIWEKQGYFASSSMAEIIRKKTLRNGGKDV